MIAFTYISVKKYNMTKLLYLQDVWSPKQAEYVDEMKYHLFRPF